MPTFALGGRLLDFEGRGELALFDETLLEEVVDCCDLVVLVSIQALCCIVFLEAIPFEIAQQRGLNRDFILPNNKPLTLAHRLVCLVPRVLLDLLCRESLIRISLKYLVNQVDALG